MSLTNIIVLLISGVLCLIQKCLNDLQTILTPNLPQDPTVDVMRNYLEYIKIFTPGGTAALSLQEQTFLAQKQLQKYYVQKVLKSEAVSYTIGTTRSCGIY